MGVKEFQWALCLSALLAASPSTAAEIHGRSSTQFLTFNNQLLGDTRQTELNEYLRFSVTKIDGDGKLSIYGYGRASQDLNNGEGFNGRLYYLYGDYRDLFDKVDLKFGRQFVNLAAGSAIVDGGQVDLKNVGPVSFTVLGGHEVQYSIDGEKWGNDRALFGVGAYLSGFQHTDAELSWMRRFDKGDVARDIIGMSAKQDILNSVKVYGNARYDITSETFNEVLGGVKYFPLAELVFTAEYYQSYATFDSTSIYSVFAVDRYREASGRVDYTVNDKVAVNAGYNRQYYGEGAAANVYHAGVSLRPVEPLRVGLEYDNRNGYYGSTNGGMVDASWQLTKAAQVAGGMTYDVYERDSMTGEEIARRYWLGGSYRLDRSIGISCRLQDDVNARYSRNLSGRVTVDYDF